MRGEKGQKTGCDKGLLKRHVVRKGFTHSGVKGRGEATSTLPCPTLSSGLDAWQGTKLLRSK